jgi:hypothetical protein
MEAFQMLKVKTGLRFGRFLLGTFVVVSLAGPAFAGNVYSWVTEDGTYAFTDDSKRIPAKHKSGAKKESMGRLTRYERFTEVSSDTEKAYAERILERRDQLRQVAAVAPQGAFVGAAAAQAGSEVGFTIPVTGGAGRAGRSGTNLWIPANDTASAESDEPTVIESRRMRSSDSLATRHWTFVKKGDKVVTVIKGQRRQQPLKALSESKFDY